MLTPVTSLPKAFSRGTHRLVSPVETIARLQPHLGAMGITRVADVTGLDHIGVPVVMVIRPNSRSLSVAQGKGLDLAAAQASGLMESIERFHAEHIALPLRLASWREMRTTLPTVEVEGLPLRANDRFHPDLPILWIEGWDLLSESPRWTPYGAVHMNYVSGQGADADCFVITSNGLASGNHQIEAMIHGLGELIERDGTALHYLRRQAEGEAVAQEARVDLRTVDDPFCGEVLEKFAAAEMAVSVWEQTSELGVPVFECQIMERNPQAWRALYPSIGQGCHSTREIALLRALTEAAQARLTYISGARDDILHEVYEVSRDRHFLAEQTASSREGHGSRSFQDVPTQKHATFDEELRDLLNRLRAAGFREAVAINLTKPEFGIPVIRMLVPGLETAGPGTPHVRAYSPGSRGRAFFEQRLRSSGASFP